MASKSLDKEEAELATRNAVPQPFLETTVNVNGGEEAHQSTVPPEASARESYLERIDNDDDEDEDDGSSLAAAIAASKKQARLRFLCLFFGILQSHGGHDDRPLGGESLQFASIATLLLLY